MAQNEIQEMHNTDHVLLHFNDAEVNQKVSKQTCFLIPENYLSELLAASGDGRTVQQFMETYDNSDAEVVYGYAQDDGKILYEDATYSDDFINMYQGYVDRFRMFNPDASPSTKAEYYQYVYYPLCCAANRSASIAM